MTQGSRAIMRSAAHSYREVALVAEAKSPGARKSAGADCSTTVVGDDAHHHQFAGELIRCPGKDATEPSRAQLKPSCLRVCAPADCLWPTAAVYSGFLHATGFCSRVSTKITHHGAFCAPPIVHARFRIRPVPVNGANKTSFLNDCRPVRSKAERFEERRRASENPSQT